MNLHHLRLFAAVVDQGGFTKAAAHLGLSQPAISKSLAELERRLNVRLIERRGRSARLTDAGRTLHARAREIFGVEQLAERELREIRGLKRGRLRVAATPAIATYLLPPLLARFHRRRPAARVVAMASKGTTVAKLLRESRVDVALSDEPIEDDRIETRKWTDDELVVIAPHDHPLAGAPALSAGELGQWTFLVDDPSSSTYALVDRELSAIGVRLRKTVRLGGTEMIKQAVAAGLGLAIVSRAAAADQLALGRIVTLSVDGLVIRRPLLRLRLRGRDRGISPASREFELLLDESADTGVAADATGISDSPPGAAMP